MRYPSNDMGKLRQARERVRPVSDRSLPHDRKSDIKLLQQYCETRDIRLRHALVLRNQHLVYLVAKQYADRGEPLEDLIQVGNIGLIKAIERYDPSKGVALSTYASATILGEVQRYFRDKCWRIKVPRDVVERYVSMRRAKQLLSNKLGRCPTIAELAENLGVTTEAVLEAMEMGQGYNPPSLDEAMGPDSDITFAANIGQPDEQLETLVEYAPLYSAIDRLSEREKDVLERYYGEQLSQVEIAKRVGVSQMQISRLHRKALNSIAAYMRSCTDERRNDDGT
jgi:RNA polymerase sigma-B factor